MPTRSGWSVLVGGLIFVTAGWLFGAVEFLVVGCGASAAVVLGVAIRRLRPSRVTVSRHLTPPRVPAGEPARIDLDVVNHARYRTPVMRLHDAVTGTNGVRISLAPLAANGGTVHGAYSLPTSRRGVLDLGPIQIEDSDGLGFARRRHHIDTRVRLIVHPPVESLPAIRVPAGDDHLLGEELSQSVGLSDEKFDGLRAYVPGDDLRKIHWPSSARLDELQVRQFQPTRHGRLTIVIDTRPPSDHADALDVTTSIAASVASAVLDAGDAIRIETTDGRATPLVAGPAQLDSLLEFLAVLDDGSSDIHPGVPTAAGSVVAVTPDPLLVTNTAMRRRFALRLRAAIIITADIKHWGDGTRGPASTADWIHLTGPGQLATQWRLVAGGDRSAAR